MSSKVETYKGKPVLVLNPEAKFPFTFGLAKAKLILDNLEAVQAFVAANETDAEAA